MGRGTTFVVWDWELEELKPEARGELIALYRSNGVTRQERVFLPLWDDPPCLPPEPGKRGRRAVRPRYLGLSPTINPACDRVPDCLLQFGYSIGGEGWRDQTLAEWEAEFNAV